jgi:hypothetical protein
MSDRERWAWRPQEGRSRRWWSGFEVSWSKLSWRRPIVSIFAGIGAVSIGARMRAGRARGGVPPSGRDVDAVPARFCLK